MKKRLLPLLLAIVMLLSLCPTVSAAYTDMSFSDHLVEYIKRGEGFMPNVYSDGTGWYIGYGVACGQYDYPNGITEAEAEALLREKMGLFATAVNNFLRRNETTVTQGQFDAMCGLSYNLGTAWLNVNNRLPAMIVNGAENYTDEEIASAFAVYCHVGNTVYEGLIRRRIIEAKMFLYEDYSLTAEGWNWIVMDANGGEHENGDVACFKSGKPYGELPTPSRSGYTFTGWQTASGSAITKDSIVSQDLYLTATWAAGETPIEPPAAEEPGPGEGEVVEPAFPDVAADAWYHDYVTELVGEGVISGHPDGLFRPEDAVTYAQALKLVLLSAGFAEQEPVETEEGEKDSHWASGYLAFAEKKGYVAKGSITDLDAAISRNEIADLSAAALELTKPEGMVNPFDDTDRASVLALYSVGILEGSIENGQRLYKGSDSIKRSEICAMLCRSIEYVDKTFILYAGYRLPIDYELEMHQYDLELLRSENGRMYYDDEAYDVRYGIDVSEHQGQIDWAKVAADGVDFAMIRAGYRSYGSASLETDDYFHANMEGALANGLDVGVYFFSQAISVEEAMEEFDYLMSLIEGYEITFPVVFDWEQIPIPGARTYTYDPVMVDKCTVAFLDAVEAAGYTPMTYFNPSMAYLKHDMRLLDHYAAWMANYVEKPIYIYDYQMWQYSSTGSVDGIYGNVDLNIAFVDFAA